MPWKMAAALTYTEPLVQGMGMGRGVHERTKGVPGRRSPEKSNLKTMPMIPRPRCLHENRNGGRRFHYLLRGFTHYLIFNEIAMDMVHGIIHGAQRKAVKIPS